ncbi:hypothetical protein SCOCK_50173 [Actinacidiphila cocklensis]|uniref:Uncharacterized protein n=1 Tax=Actinacidiphila cocklensis TaxID=887465 RepID=A0A9W4DX98_9ACTN|nr:hypothetical protein SCOCK_50173 [Actinacidiphila cocklensis]
MSIEQSGKVTAEHLRRDAYPYVCQSSLRQVVNNSESAQRQYALRGRTDSQIIVIDSDQGRTGASTAGRGGFQHLVAEVSMGDAGIVLGLECPAWPGTTPTGTGCWRSVRGPGPDPGQRRILRPADFQRPPRRPRARGVCRHSLGTSAPAFRGSLTYQVDLAPPV